jgi:outer membrane protein assembly complex protein YaeT
MLLPGSTAHAARRVGDSPIAVHSIRFRGNYSLTDHELKGAMQTAEATFSKRLFGAKSIEYDPIRFQLDLRSIRYLYQKKGFIRAEITGFAALIDSISGVVDLRVDLAEGERYHFGQVSVSGVESVDSTAVLAMIDTQPGEDADLHRVQKNARAIRDLYLNEGFARARVDFDTIVREEDLRVDLRYRIREGERYSIGWIEVNGNLLTHSDVILREMGLRPGSAYRLSTIRDDERELYNTGLFSGVKISEAAVDTVERRVHLRVDLIERKPRWVVMAIGSSTNQREDFRVSTEWGHKNLFGGARLLSVRLQSSWQTERVWKGGHYDPLSSRFEVTYLQPWLLGIPIRTGGSLFAAQEIPLGRQEHLSTWGVTARLLYDIGNDAEIYVEPKLQWANESAEGLISGKEVSQTKSVTLAYRLDSRANIFAPNGGTWAAASITGAGGILGGDFEFWKVTSSYARYWALGNPNWVAAARVAVGAAWPFASSERIPLDQVFIAGGATSVRGYLEGAVAVPGTPEEGGRSRLLCNLELRLPLISYFGFTPFFDGGQVWPFLDHIDPPRDLRWTAGAEFRYQTPIGPLRVGYGAKLNRSAEDPDPGAWFFGFGQVF